MIITGSDFDPRRKSQHYHWYWMDEWPLCWKYPTSWRFPWTLFGGASPRVWGSFPQILSAIVGLSTGSAICGLCHRISRWSERRFDVRFLVLIPFLISRSMQMEPKVDARTRQGHGIRIRRKRGQYCPWSSHEHGKTRPRYDE